MASCLLEDWYLGPGFKGWLSLAPGGTKHWGVKFVRCPRMATPLPRGASLRLICWTPPYKQRECPSGHRCNYPSRLIESKSQGICRKRPGSTFVSENESISPIFVCWMRTEITWPNCMGFDSSPWFWNAQAFYCIVGAGSRANNWPDTDPAFLPSIGPNYRNRNTIPVCWINGRIGHMSPCHPMITKFSHER